MRLHGSDRPGSDDLDQDGSIAEEHVSLFVTSEDLGFTFTEQKRTQLVVVTFDTRSRRSASATDDLRTVWRYLLTSEL